MRKPQPKAAVFSGTIRRWQLLDATWVFASRAFESSGELCGFAGYKSPEIEASCVLTDGSVEQYTTKILYERMAV